eukprot:CAMPEP_0168596978 /NCGR_PEP_ID=MMETSP0420-20121227/10337_1 /TAXON_ID=498008 /ORGANISM="Pessonella sp." /LENGTH=169 /DNA_ID=CAMNT_0008633635 /DNA_START=114 /DNA_END=620 /DNA_ORIENTATION=-
MDSLSFSTEEIIAFVAGTVVVLLCACCVVGVLARIRCCNNIVTAEELKQITVLGFIVNFVVLLIVGVTLASDDADRGEEGIVWTYVLVALIVTLCFSCCCLVRVYSPPAYDKASSRKLSSVLVCDWRLADATHKSVDMKRLPNTQQQAAKAGWQVVAADANDDNFKEFV